jgi:hypothetical protein
MGQPDAAPATNPKGTVADHWTWRDGQPRVTGWHVKRREGEPVPPPAPMIARGLVTGTTVQRKHSRPKQEQLL